MEKTEREFALQHLAASRERLIQAVEGLTAEQHHFRPAEDRWSVADCIEHITVVRGVLHCHLGANEVVLEEGDSVTFAADVEHSFTNREKKPTRCLLLVDISQAHNMRPGR